MSAAADAYAAFYMPTRAWAWHPLAKRMPTHKVTFLPDNVVVEVDPECYPYGRTGEPGSVLDIALTHGVDILHACEGSGVCGTCHVIVTAGAENLSEADDDEMDAVEQVAGNELASRLACQAVVGGDVTVRVPC